MQASEEDLQKKRLEKKRKLRELFDEQYDGGDAAYLEGLKEEVQKQGEVRDRPPTARHGRAPWKLLMFSPPPHTHTSSAQQGRV